MTLLASSPILAAAEGPFAGTFSNGRMTIKLAAAKNGAFTVTGTDDYDKKHWIISGTLTKAGQLRAKSRIPGHGEGNKVDGYWDSASNSIVVTQGSSTNGNITLEMIQRPLPGSVPSFAGTFDTDWGKVTLSQSARHVKGTSVYGEGGTIDGDITADGSLNFKWTQKNPATHGIGTFRTSPGGFTGSWQHTDAKGNPVHDGGSWNGKRVG